MSTIHLQQTTTSTPEQYVAGLTDHRSPERRSQMGTRIASRVTVSANLLSSSSSRLIRVFKNSNFRYLGESIGERNGNLKCN
jgi:hypothetical protein